jgi:hypothetical protein
MQADESDNYRRIEEAMECSNAVMHADVTRERHLATLTTFNNKQQ